MSEQISERERELLAQGKAPGRGAALREVNTGLDSLTDFLRKHYLQTYLREGGSKIKFISGRTGSGKTHLAQCLLDDAEAEGYLTVSFSAREVWLHDFREVYLEILRQCDIERVLAGCAAQIVREMGFDPAAIGEGKTLLDYLAEQGEGDALSRGEIRSALRRYFTRNPLLYNGFAACCSLLLSHPKRAPAAETTATVLTIDLIPIMCIILL